MKKYKVLFSDFDSTLVFTASGKKFPVGIWDMVFNFKALDAIKNLSPEVIHICTNQGGIQKGFVIAEHFEHKMQFSCDCISEYLGGIPVFYDYCDSLDKSDVRRKPNPGLLMNFIESQRIFHGNNYSKDDCLMIGDASDSVKNFSDDDKKTAENFGCDYLDINDFIKTYNP